MGYKVVVEPAYEPVTVSECKLVARFTATAMDTLIEEQFIPAARRICEQRTGRSLITQHVRKTLDAWPSTNDIELRFGPVQSIQSFTYIDANEDEQTVSSDIYTVDNKDALRPAWILLKEGESWPDAGCFANAITVTFVAGYGDESDDVPRELRLWIMAAVANMIKTGIPDVPGGFCAGLLDREAMPAV